MHTITPTADPLSTSAEANCAKLPPMAYGFIACHPEGERIVIVKRGETGYHHTTLDDPGMTTERCKALVKLYNDRLGVTAEQKAALLCGSLFGFHVPGADPANYNGEVPKNRTEVRS